MIVPRPPNTTAVAILPRRQVRYWRPSVSDAPVLERFFIGRGLAAALA